MEYHSFLAGRCAIVFPQRRKAQPLGILIFQILQQRMQMTRRVTDPIRELGH